MSKFSLKNFGKINTIIERDAKDTTYKFALLKAVIEISDEFSHLRREKGNKIFFPLGLIVHKWLLFYYPLIESSKFIPQKHGESPTSKKKITFRKIFRKITDYYSDKGGFSFFYNDYINETIPTEITNDFLNLVKILVRTITTMPMRYLGRSIIKKEYPIFNYQRSRIKSVKSIGKEFVINNLGLFTFPLEYYELFQFLGSFITGETSIICKWAEFCYQTQEELEYEYILKKLRTYPITEKDYYEARLAYEKIFKEKKYLECVWSGKSINKFKTVQVDHVIPFSIWKNNDLWNLLPSHKNINAKKGDKIPSPKLIDDRYNKIVNYWEELQKIHPKRFKREIAFSLVGNDPNNKEWRDLAIDRLKEKCEYLINVRGLEEWSL